jgi:hypothetical protein
MLTMPAPSSPKRPGKNAALFAPKKPTTPKKKASTTGLDTSWEMNENVEYEPLHDKYLTEFFMMPFRQKHFKNMGLVYSYLV